MERVSECFQVIDTRSVPLVPYSSGEQEAYSLAMIRETPE